MTDRKIAISYRVPYADTDMMGVVYYANYLVFFERARNQLLTEAGLPYKELEKKGYMLPVIEAHLEYKQPAEYDDVLDILSWVSWIKGARLRIDCEVKRGDLLLVHGHTVHAMIERSSWRPVRVPAEFYAFYGGEPEL